LEILPEPLIAFGHLLLAKFVALLLLLQHKQHIFLPVAFLTARDFFLAYLHPPIPKRSPLIWIAFANQDGFHDRLPRHPAHVIEHIGELDIHLRERLLHSLNMPTGRPHQIIDSVTLAAQSYVSSAGRSSGSRDRARFSRRRSMGCSTQ
jgi:hypothetical protein